MIGGRRPLQGRKPADRRVRVERPHSPYFRYTGPGQMVAKAAANAPKTALGRTWARIRGVAIGRPLASEEEAGERLTKKKALAIFSSDAISSSAYATQEIIRVQNPTPNSDVGIYVGADEIVEATEAGPKFYRLSGVFVKQGNVECKAKRGVVRMTGEAGKSHYLDVYLEEDVFVQNGPFKPSGARGYVELATRLIAHFFRLGCEGYCLIVQRNDTRSSQNRLA
jgi:hypothetical protein